MARRMAGSVSLGLALGWLADLGLGDPQRGHPVAGFGQLARALESRVYRDDRPAGAAYTALLVGAASGLGWTVQRAVRGRSVATVAATAAATWVVLGGRSLVRVSEQIAAHLESGDIEAARALMPSLVSRDPETLDVDGIARATLESVAENTSDAVVAPLFWGACLGIPGLLGYRAINTLDAMVAYRNDRYLNFGWATAKLDDIVNWVPARISAGLAVASAPLVGGDPAEAVRAVNQQAKQHPSPNGGVVEAAFAGALGVKLGGVNVYDGVVEDRGELGFGPAPASTDLVRGNRLALAVSAGSALMAAGLALLRGRR